MTITLEQIIWTALCGSIALIFNQFRIRLNRMEADIKDNKAEATENKNKSEKIEKNYINRFDEIKGIINNNHIEVIKSVNQVEKNLNEKLLMWKEN